MEIYPGVVVNKYNACCRRIAFPALEMPETINCCFMGAVKTEHEQDLQVSRGSPGPHLQHDLQDPSMLLTAPVFDIQR